MEITTTHTIPDVSLNKENRWDLLNQILDREIAKLSHSPAPTTKATILDPSEDYNGSVGEKNYLDGPSPAALSSHEPQLSYKHKIRVEDHGHYRQEPSRYEEGIVFHNEKLAKKVVSPTEGKNVSGTPKNYLSGSRGQRHIEAEIDALHLKIAELELRLADPNRIQKSTGSKGIITNSREGKDFTRSTSRPKSTSKHSSSKKRKTDEELNLEYERTLLAKASPSFRMRSSQKIKAHNDFEAESPKKLIESQNKSEKKVKRRLSGAGANISTPMTYASRTGRDHNQSLEEEDTNQELTVLNKKLLSLKEDKKKVKKDLDSEKRRNTNLESQLKELEDTYGKVKMKCARAKNLESDYGKLLESFKVSERIRKQQQVLITRLNEQLTAIKEHVSNEEATGRRRGGSKRKSQSRSVKKR